MFQTTKFLILFIFIVLLKLNVEDKVSFKLLTAD